MQAEIEGSSTEPYYTEISTANTVFPRYIAAMIDNVLATVLAIVAAKQVNEEKPIWQVLVLVAVFLGYYFVFELLISRTPGKLFTGLVIVGVDGECCTWQQAAIRTAFRVLEVNPLLLGAIPAALSVVYSHHHQRFGDKLAETLVVERRVLRQYLASVS